MRSSQFKSSHFSSDTIVFFLNLLQNNRQLIINQIFKRVADIRHNYVFSVCLIIKFQLLTGFVFLALYSLHCTTIREVFNNKHFKKREK